MLHHLSISAENPEKVAQVLAEIMGGIVVPFKMRERVAQGAGPGPEERSR